MTEQNQKRNISDELSRSEQCLEEGELLQKNGLYSGAVSRLYYAVLHGVRALLLSKGLEPKSHEGALQLLNLRFVKEGMLDREASRFFARLMKYREEADYSAAFDFTQAEYSQFRKEADILLGSIREYLRKEKLI